MPKKDLPKRKRIKLVTLLTHPEADLLGVVHVVEPDGEALRAEPDRLHAAPLCPRRKEPQAAAVPDRGGQVLTQVHPQILCNDFQLNIS